VSPEPGPVVELARAKVNLHLHVLGRRRDGYHLLDSLAVFPELGDRLEAEPASGLSLSVGGPFADQLPSDGANLVLRAAEALARLAGPGRGAAIRLEKALPVAGGIGGGSADAAATLRALMRLWGFRPSEGALARLALSLGADVPVCLAAPRPALMGGVGEVLRRAPPMPEVWLALANPGVPVATAEVFRRLERRDGRAAEPPAAGFRDARALAGWLAWQSNMLEDAAEAVAPAVGETRRALSETRDCLLARMSGSGGTCFGLYAAEAEALAAAETMRARGLWAAAAPVRASARLAAV
jgi:4-diphosphocytidyl-2-C-methyl-D-erythritol kinase